MHPQLEILLQIQDLKAQRRELLELEEPRQVEVRFFHVDVDRAVAELDRKIREMEEQLQPSIRSRYQRVGGEEGRAVVPVIGGVCYGCFVSIPTAVATDAARHEAVRHCDHCGRFLYVVD